MAPVELIDKAEAAGLVYLDDGTHGYRRVKRGTGFSYVDPSGDTVDGETRSRIKSLVIPPAWEDVWISTNPNSHILATGIDDAGRKQYIYHPVWEEVRDEIKFNRLVDFGLRVKRLRKTVDGDLRQPGLPRTKVIALAVSLLDRTLIRVGNRRYVNDNDSYGLTTLTGDHVEISGHRVHLEFAGKGGAEHQMAFRDRRLAALITSCQELSGQTLFSYENGNGLTAVTSTDVNDYLATAAKGRFTAKDFRTWGASTTVASYLAENGHDDHDTAILEAIDAAAEKLGNTRAVARSSYVHPAVPEAFVAGRLSDAWSRSRSGKWLARSESALNRILGETDPD